MAAPAYFKVDGVALLNNSPEVDDSTAFCVAVPRLPCVMGRPEAAGSSGKADSGAGPFKVSLVGASKKVSRKHVSVDWNSKIGQYEASVCGSLSITVDGEPLGSGACDPHCGESDSLLAQRLAHMRSARRRRGPSLGKLAWPHARMG